MTAPEAASDVPVLTPGEEHALLSAAARAAGARLLHSRRRTVHHRTGRNRSVLHDAEIEVDGVRREVVLVTHVDLRGYPEGALVLAGDDVEAAVWRFPYDPYLPGLPSAVSAVRVRELLDRLGVPEGQVRIRMRAYRPSRRGVVEVRIDGAVGGRVLYAKVLPPARARSVARRHRQLRAAGLPVPGVVGLARSQGILALEALDGPTLGEALRGTGPLPEPRDLVALSERIAVSGVHGARDPRAFADPTRHVPLLCELLPERAVELADLAAQAVAVSGSEVGVHGDLHPGQLLLGSDGAITGVLDVDGAGQGLLAHDAGNLLAHLEVLGDLNPLIAGRVRELVAGVGDAYGEVVGRPALARATAASWLALATGAHRAQRPDWQVEVARRVDRAAAHLAAE